MHCVELADSARVWAVEIDLQTDTPTTAKLPELPMSAATDSKSTAVLFSCTVSSAWR